MGRPKSDFRQKVMGIPIEKSLQTSEDGFLLVRGFFTSDSRDEVGDIITRDATIKAIPNYRKWGNIRRMHAPDPVGKVIRIGEEDGLAWNEVEIKVIDPKARFEVENGLLSALSVGILVDFNKVNMLQDGGWQINEYKLAEISLVDHPANYDAMLELSIMGNSAARQLIREKGLEVMKTKEFDEVLHAEEDVKEIEVTPEPVETVEKEITPEQIEEVIEEKAVEPEPEPDPEDEDEDEDKEDEDEEKESEEEKSLAEEVPTENVIVEITEEHKMENSDSVKFDELNATLKGMADAISALVKRLEPSTEVPVEEVKESEPAPVLEKEEKSITNEDKGELDSLREQVIALTEKVKELSSPVEPVGKMPAPPQKEEIESSTEKDIEPADLRSALRKKFGVN